MRETEDKRSEAPRSPWRRWRARDVLRAPISISRFLRRNAWALLETWLMLNVIAFTAEASTGYALVHLRLYHNSVAWWFAQGLVVFFPDLVPALAPGSPALAPDHFPIIAILKRRKGATLAT